MPSTNPRFGIDTSILVRLVTGLPEPEFDATVQSLSQLVQEQGAVLLASNMVIGEAYVAMQHHYGLSKTDVRAGLRSALSSGLVKPAGGNAILDVIAAASAGCGLMDRLIAQDYSSAQANTLTLDRKMAKLSGAKLLSAH